MGLTKKVSLATAKNSSGASAAYAIGEAYKRVRNGEAKLMVAGGGDVPLSYSTMKAWEALRVMAPGDADTSPFACRPFAADRRGLVLGEGGAALFLANGRVVAFDAAIDGGLPGTAITFSRRMARNTQLLLLEESHLGRVVDPSGGSWFVEDLGSTNGTFVNGERITSQRLDDGDRVTMGRVSFVIRTRRR